MPSVQECQGFGCFPGGQLPLRVGFLVRELVDQVGEGLPVLSGELLQECDHRLECGNMNNPGDAAKMSDPAFRVRIATSLAAGLKQYLRR
ncbi:hypothetical protein ITP53_51330 [Nonomuraea sp. K274]|uniref:N-acetylmuramoyl-L-alanine amidase n=1 Tax=Nonomuraea cypriaca TaxID=1187855 RepID=A0A931ALE6_9ACTN|nr:hypothetical protein [Nonomuraea cypriaca]MBF8193935.1 hypothetical protein [Nonomuraea cypriaca]